MKKRIDLGAVLFSVCVSLVLSASVFAQAQTAKAKQLAFYLERGKERLDKGDYDKALADCDAALNVSARDARVYLLRGKVWLAKKDYNTANKDFDRALKRDDKLAEAHFRHGQACMQMNKSAQAQKEFARAHELDASWPLDGKLAQ